MRGLLSGLAIAANVLLVVFAVFGMSTDHKGPHGDVSSTSLTLGAVFISFAALNLAAIAAGARIFKPKPPITDVVSTFN
jgi:hypothetical protein